MSNAFDKALINRERSRQQLAEVLEAKYSAERRSQAIFRLGFAVAAIGVAAIAIRSGLNNANNLASLADIKPKKQTSGKGILDQMQKQMQDGDHMMIGAGDTPKTRKEPSRSNGEPSSFTKETVPLNLTGDLRSGKKQRTGQRQIPKELFTQPSAQKEKELSELRNRKNARKKTSAGMYRPATGAEEVGNPTPKHTGKAPVPQNLYEQVKQPPSRLTPDAASYPDLLHANRLLNK